ncbi:substrate-binding periplasmic protein [Brevibacillus marinus]|uniref:substrate-binding periplasmic protein n=1 Tax=Brevibacillus marinus TaxID=2496837 RepID=UPI000F839DD8|nr:transporter substrate-binding domain-containing protein [Brevibacillus marinus]
MKKPLAALFSIALLLVMTACGSNAANPTSHTATGEAQQAESTNTLEKIKQAGKIVIGTTGNYRPFTYMDSNNQLVGYDIEWGNIIAEELGVKAEFVTGQFAGLIPGLVAGKFDVVMSGANITEERKKSIDFSVPYAQDGAVAVIKKGSNAVSGVTDIKGKVVGVNAGSAFEAVVKQIGGYKELKEYPGAAESFADLAAGRVDVVVIGIVAAGEYIKNSPSGQDIEIVGDIYEVRDIGVGIRKNDPLKAEIDKIIEAKKQDGTYQRLTEKYFGLTFDN